jgi:hypothetical protein
VSLFELNAWEDERLLTKNIYKIQKKKNKAVFFKKGKISDVICVQYTNICKLGANRDGKSFKTIKIDKVCFILSMLCLQKLITLNRFILNIKFINLVEMVCSNLLISPPPSPRHDLGMDIFFCPF